MRLVAAGAAVTLAVALCTAGAALAADVRAATAPPLVTPYKDVTRGLGSAQPLIADEGAPATLIWAFATGECGQEQWGEPGSIDTEAFARANVARAAATGRRYIVSTGGALGIFTCGSSEGLARFVARYDSPLLAGLDFDIEGAQTPEQIRSLVAQLAPLARARPELRLSFTLATHAGSDGASRGLNATGRAVLAALREHRMERAVINLMVMNYGEPSARWCVPRRAKAGTAPSCDMARSALQAVQHLRRQHGVPLSRIAVTAMPGENDVERNVFTLADARLLTREARRLGLEGLHWWSLDRDRPCAQGEPRVSPHCHALPATPADGGGATGVGAFGAIFLGQ